MCVCVCVCVCVCDLPANISEVKLFWNELEPICLQRVKWFHVFFFIIQGFRTLAFIFIDIFPTTFFMRFLSNSQTYMELLTTFFIWSMVSLTLIPLTMSGPCVVTRLRPGLNQQPPDDCHLVAEGTNAYNSNAMCLPGQETSAKGRRTYQPKLLNMTIKTKAIVRKP